MARGRTSIVIDVVSIIAFLADVNDAVAAYRAQALAFVSRWIARFGTYAIANAVAILAEFAKVVTALRFESFTITPDEYA